MLISILTEIIKGLIIGTGSYGSKTFPDPLSKEEEEILIKQMLNKDKDARNKLVEHNLRLVAHIVKKYDSKKVEDTKKTIGVQVNGKLRGTIEVNVTDSKEVVEAKAKELENVQNFINGKEIVKIIIVPNKIVNIVVK